MAVSHLINCMLLTYAPYFVVYKAKNLYKNRDFDYRAYKLVLSSVLACLITAFCRIFLLAIFSVYLPASENNITIKFFEYIFNLIDFYGIYMLQKQKVSNIDNAQAKDGHQCRVLQFIYFIQYLMHHVLKLKIENLNQKMSSPGRLYQEQYIQTQTLQVNRAIQQSNNQFENVIFVGLVLTVAKNSRRNNYNIVQDISLISLIVLKAVGIPLIVQNEFTLTDLPYKIATTSGFVLIAQPFIKL